MTESATQIIAGRTDRPERLTPMVLYSTLAHAVLLVVVPLLLSLGPDEPPPTRMVISLSGGAPGPRTEGLTQMGGRPVQQVAPEAPVRPAEPSPPEKPRMALPEPKPAPPTPEPSKPASKPEPAPAGARAASTPRPAPPAAGDEIRPGSTPVETRARGTGFGLSSAGGGASGTVQLDVKNFCCPEYIERMRIEIQRNWQQNQGRAGVSVVKFTILRDGTIDDVSVDRRSGVFSLDQAAERAVLLTRQLPKLPDAFPNPTLTVHLTFRY